MAEGRRRIATLLAAGVVDGTRLLASSETEAQKALRTRREIFHRLIQEFGGRFVRTTGSNLVAEFANAVDAMRAALALQLAILKENEPLPHGERVRLRIGLNVGDVVEYDGDLEGDGVDVAIELQSLAVPGGICLTGSVNEHTGQQLQVGVEMSGKRKVRSAPTPIAIYQVVEPGIEKGHFSLWEELKRRSVVRTGIGYAIVAWLLIQVANVILPNFNAPDWAQPGFILLVILGFPVALVLAWIYELTPMGMQRSDGALRQDGIKWLTGRRLDAAIISVLVAAIVFLAFERYGSDLLGPELGPVDSIAVLAFENIGEDPNNGYFADGLAEELLSALGRIPELRVASRTASFYYKDKDVDVATIASTLMVAKVLSGSVRRFGDRVVVNVALEDADTRETLWDMQYDERLEDIFAIQSKVASDVAIEIVPLLSEELQARITAPPTENSLAYENYLRAREYMREPAEEATLASAIGLFDRAIDLDARFAEAYAGLCQAHLGSYEFARRPSSFTEAERACNRAISLDNNLWETRVALGSLYTINGRYDDAMLELQFAIDQQPNAVSSYLALAQTYEDQGRFEQAEDTLLRAEEIDSGYWGVHRALGNFYYDLSRYDEAIERHLRVVELVPDNGIGYDNLGIIYLALGNLEQAETILDASPLPSRWTYETRGLAHYYAGDFANAVEDQLQAINVAPDFHVNWGFLGDAYRFLPGKEDDAAAAYAAAIQLAEQALSVNAEDWRVMGLLGMYLAYVGRGDEAETRAREMLARSSSDSAYYWAARVFVQTGDEAAAYENLHQVVDLGWPRSLLEGDPDFAPLRGDSRFEAILAAAR